MKKLYMFDCFGVIINEVSHVWMKRHGVTSKESIAKKEALSDKNDLGKISEDELYQSLSRLYGQEPEEIKMEWYNTVKVNSDVAATTKELRNRGAKVVILSNSGEFIHSYLRKVGADNIWDEKFLSYELGIMKPDPRIYKYALEKMGVKPEDACFIDDREVNVRAAEELGIEGILYPSEEFSKLVE